MWVLAHGQRFVWFEHLTGTKGGSSHGFFLSTCPDMVPKGKGGVGIKRCVGLHDILGRSFFYSGHVYM